MFFQNSLPKLKLIPSRHTLNYKPPLLILLAQYCVEVTIRMSKKTFRHSIRQTLLWLILLMMNIKNCVRVCVCRLNKGSAFVYIHLLDTQ